jgi:xanthine dehydrogenase large subunit
MGQGVNTKIASVASRSLGIPVQKIKVMTTSTEKNHNTSPTAASSGSDINGAATLKACDLLKNRLTIVAEALIENSSIDHFNDEEIKLKSPSCIAEFKDEKIIIKNKTLNIQDVIQVCYLHRISLGEYAFFKTEGLGFNKKTGKGVAFKYFTNGAAVSEIEIDTYTGQMKVLRSDILMDLGKTLNQGIDIGQISGAFVQGMGWLTSENLFHNSEGKLLSHSPTTYKIPNIQDTPRIFNINLFNNPYNIDNVFSSKAVGEPPLLLAASVWCAIKNALNYKKETHSFFAPATPEEILNHL